MDRHEDTSQALNAVEEADENLSVLPEMIDGVKKNDMMKHYLGRQAQQEFENWKDEYERRKTSEQIAEYQKRLREKFIEAIGGLPERTPLNPRVTGEGPAPEDELSGWFFSEDGAGWVFSSVVRRDGYCVEKVIIESQPKHYVTAALFLPESDHFKPPYPGVLVACGHAPDAKADSAYQTMGALLAKNGMAALVFDPIGQGERGQLLKDLPELWGVSAHNWIGVGSILLGRNTARFEIWDGMRCIDYLQSRPDIDPKRIGCTGHSGGGLQTAYLMALDDRIVAAAPSCWIGGCELVSGAGDAEQDIYGQLAFGMRHADHLMMRAPDVAILICAATKDIFDIRGTWESFRYAKRLYTRMGFAERIDIIEADQEHSFGKLHREAVVRWMARWLRNFDEPITEPPIKILSDKEIRCTMCGQVMLLKGARSVYDLNRDYEKELAERRRQLWATTERTELLNRVRQIAGIHKLAELPKPKVQSLNVVEQKGYQIKKMVLKPEEGIYLPALMFVPTEKAKGAVLYVHEKGRAADAAPDGLIEKLVKAGQVVLVVDLRGMGETQQSNGETLGTPGVNVGDIFMAYLLGRSYVGMQAEDILVCARWLTEHEAVKKTGYIRLIAVGSVGVPALHAAALEPDLFGSVKLVRSLISWSNLIELGRSRNQLINTVHGALTTYDLNDLAATLGSSLTIEQPVDALGEPIQTAHEVEC